MKTLSIIAVIAAVTTTPSISAYAHSEKKDVVTHQGHSAHDTKGVKIESAWARATPGKTRNGGAYFVLKNTGSAPDRLVAVRGDIAKRVEIHTHHMDNGVMRMRRVKGIDLPAGASVQMKPGGYHVMFIGLHKPLKKNEQFPLTLVFERAGEMNTIVSVKSVGAMDGTKKHDMKGHGSHKGH